MQQAKLLLQQAQNFNYKAPAKREFFHFILFRLFRYLLFWSSLIKFSLFLFISFSVHLYSYTKDSIVKIE